MCCANIIFVTCHAMKKMGTWFVSVPDPIQHLPSSTTILRQDTVFLALGVTALVEKIRHTGLDCSQGMSPALERQGGMELADYPLRCQVYGKLQ